MDDGRIKVRALLNFPERRPGATLTIIAVVFAVAYAASLILIPKPDGRIIMGDAVHHYVQLRSLVFDRDLHLRNEYLRVYKFRGDEPEATWLSETTPTGHVRSYMPVGPGLVWAPAFLLVSGTVWLADSLGANYPLDGYGRAFQAAAAFSGVIAAAIGSWLAFLSASALFDRRPAIWATLAVWLSSSALYYSLISPTYSHAASMLAVGAFWLAWMRSMERQTVARYGMMGVLAGVAALMRWQDGVLLLLPVIDALRHWRRGTTGSVAARLAALAVGTLVGFAPQIAFWTIVYGQPFALPQGPAFMKWTEPALWSVMFSNRRGLVMWTPIIALSLVGLVPLFRRDRFIAFSALTFFLISWYVNAAVADWWAGEAFGARRFLSCYPVFVLGLAALFNSWRSKSAVYAGVTGAFVLYTLLLLVQYQAFMHGLRGVIPYPDTPDGLWLARFRSPFIILDWWLNRS